MAKSTPFGVIHGLPDSIVIGQEAPALICWQPSSNAVPVGVPGPSDFAQPIELLVAQASAQAPVRRAIAREDSKLEESVILLVCEPRSKEERAEDGTVASLGEWLAQVLSSSMTIATEIVWPSGMPVLCIGQRFFDHDRTTVLEWLHSVADPACWNEAELEKHGVIPSGVGLRKRKEQSNQQLDDRQQGVLEGLNSLKLPEIDRVTRELSSTRQNRLATSSIALAQRSLPKLLDAQIARHEELGVSPTAAQIKRLLALCTPEKRESIYRQLQRDLGHGEIAQNIRATADTHIGKVSSINDIDRIREAFLSRVVFGDAEPCKEGFVAWFESIRGREVPTREEKRAVAAAISHFCRQFGLQLMVDGGPVSLGVPGGSNREAGAFQLQPLGASASRKRGIGHAIPRETTLH